MRHTSVYFWKLDYLYFKNTCFPPIQNKYLPHRIKNLDFMWTQEWEFPEHWENKYNLFIYLFICAGLFSRFRQLNMVVPGINTHFLNNQDIFYVATLTSSFINFKYSYVIEFLNYTCLRPLKQMLSMVWDMLYFAHMLFPLFCFIPYFSLLLFSWR